MTFYSDMETYKMSVFCLVKGLFEGHCFFAVRLYRRGNWLYRHHVKFFPELIKKKMLRSYACEISPYAKIGSGLKIHHSIGIVVGHEVIIGNNCEIFQNVTIGSNRKERNGRHMPTIGDNVTIGTGAVIVGPISIGNDVIIGANTYVDFDVPDRSFVCGAKGRILLRRADRGQVEISDFGGSEKSKHKLNCGATQN